ncbi:SdrD B-like domain-containing protein [Aquabacterium sp. J223]|uniref:SdrD B-like domain-containing protein n=1 Tax=Aquabacterium sp. J223 TaxID=2898431 RepID=UPI0021AD8A47|nr:SdrD B-like domain-containing protein [Aquabacterium sp. J223]UUX95088.1 hypothetical protein LRS07_17885 [Aquabacterium sp. J223]
MAVPVLNGVVHLCEDTSKSFDIADLLTQLGYPPTGAVKITAMLADDGGTLKPVPTQMVSLVDSDTFSVNAAARPDWFGQFNTLTLTVDSAPNSVQIRLQVVVDSVNDAPDGADKDLGTVTAAGIVLNEADFGFSDAHDAAGPGGANAFKSVLVTSLPGAGSLLLDGVAVQAGDQIPVQAIRDGLLKYVPPTDSAGEVQFGFKVQDDGGTAGCNASDTDASANYLTFRIPFASLGDRVWFDTDRDGVQDDGEAGAAGVKVTLIGGGVDGVIGTADDTEVSTVTDGLGNYRFDHLTPGTQYQVQFSDLPADHTFTSRDVGDDAADSDADTVTGKSQIVTLTPGEHNPTLDAGLVTKPASLGDRVWFDADRDGVQDDGEAGAAGVKATLIGGGLDGVIGTADDTATVATTDANGLYKFDGLIAGTQYQVQFSDLPAGYQFTSKDVGDDAADSDADAVTGKSQIVTLAPGEHNPTLDAGLVTKLASLGDRVWFDADRDGVQDDGEAGAAGVKVTLIGGGLDGVIGTADDTATVATTDANGLYKFDGLIAGTQYQVQFSDLPTGYQFTKKDVGDDAADSDADTVSGKSQIVTLAPGEHNPTLDAGLVQVKTAKLGDRVWVDCDNDGIQDAGEDGVAGVKVILRGAGNDGLFNTADDVLASTTTNSNGNYLFANLAAGKYQVTFGTVDGYDFAKRDQGADDARDSDADTTTGVSQVVTLAAGETNLTVDAGLVKAPKGSIGDRVWLDCDGDGIQDSGEDGVCGVKVTLTGAGKDGTFGTADDTTAVDTTDAYGRYRFDNLSAGKYQVTFGTVDGYDFTRRDQGAYDSKDSDADTTTGKSHVIDLAAGEVDLTVDAGLVKAPKGSIGDRVWLDCDGDGIQDSGEDGVCGVKVTLTGAGKDGTFGTADDITAVDTTDAYGRYRFDNLAAGKYTVTFGTIAGHEFTRKDQGAYDSKDSDAGSNGKTDVITLAAGEVNLTVDAGLVEKACASIVGCDSMYEGTKASFKIELSKAVAYDTRIWVSAIDGTADRTNAWAGNQKITAGGYYTESAEGNKAFWGEYYDPATGLKHQKATGPSDMSADYAIYDTAGNLIGSAGGFWVTVQAGKTSSALFSVEAWKEAVYVDRDVFPNGSTAYKEAAWESFTLKLSNSSNASVDICEPTKKVSIGDTSTYSLYSPIVLDLDGNGIQTTALIDSKGSFDLLGTGKAVQSGWISAGDAFLAVDGNANGRIDDIHELFGGKKGDGFAKLASFDSNGDGVVDAQDARFGELRVWQDLDGDHQTDAGELRTLGEAGIASLTVDYLDQAIDQLGNVLGETSTATRADGSSLAMVDVYFNLSAEDAAAAPALGDLLGSTNTLLDQVFGTASANSAAVCDGGGSEAEALRQLAGLMQQQQQAAQVAVG